MATILSAARLFLAEALRRESSASREVARVYGIASERIGRELARLLDEYRRSVAAGETPSRAWLMRADRVVALIRAAQIETRMASDSAESAIRSAQAQMVELAAGATREMLGVAGVRDVFSPPVAALDRMAGYLGDGSPLRRLLGAMPMGAGAKVESALIEGIAMGQNPRETARIMRNGVEGVLDRAKSRTLTIARTETMRVHRDAILENYKANAEAVRGWVWLCACDLRSCPSCWAMHGTFHDHREVFGSHPNCRCSPLPQVRGLPAIIPEDQSGVARFGRLSDEKQEEILGPLKFGLYKSGRIGLENLSVKTYDRNWGPQRHEASARRALDQAGERRKAA